MEIFFALLLKEKEKKKIFFGGFIDNKTENKNKKWLWPLLECRVTFLKSWSCTLKYTFDGLRMKWGQVQSIVNGKPILKQEA